MAVLLPEPQLFVWHKSNVVTAFWGVGAGREGRCSVEMSRQLCGMQLRSNGEGRAISTLHSTQVRRCAASQGSEGRQMGVTPGAIYQMLTLCLAFL